MTLEEIGDEYIARKFSKGRHDMYLNYVDYHHTLCMKKGDYENALVFLAKRIIFEINTWLSRQYHPPFDEAMSLETDELLFEFNKLGLDLDLDRIYERSYDELEMDKLKCNHDANLGYFKRLVGGDDIFIISDELMHL